KLDEKSFGKLWADLAGPDASRSYRALWALRDHGDRAVSLLKARLKPTPDASATLKKLLADLDSKRFAVRKKAGEELERLGSAAEPSLREALKGKLSDEARKRVSELLAALTDGRVLPEELRQLRAVLALEVIGTAEARKLLKSLADGWSSSRQTQEARA